MIIAVALVVAYAAGVDARRLGVLAGAVLFPWIAGALIALVVWRAKPDEDSRPALFCEGVAAELRGGSTLRHALGTAATSVQIAGSPPVYRDDLPMAQLAAALGEAFPAISQELRLTILGSARSGGQVADLFDEIGSLAIAHAENRREIRVATAPGRATALLLVGAPVAYLIMRAGSGGLNGMFETSQQRIVVLIGLGLFCVGAVLAGLITWRATR